MRPPKEPGVVWQNKIPACCSVGLWQSQHNSNCIFPLVYPIHPTLPLPSSQYSFVHTEKKCYYNEHCMFTMSFSGSGSQKDVDILLAVAFQWR